ncbi:MAG: hypothetical protein QOH97_5169 [Actinoplanes sp.]|jgi:hypothetical protein|nr:hypothetical protein [Actinoplanes sp.]
MTRLERLAYWLVRRAARRWPEDLAEPMTADWLAELDVLHTQSGVGQMLTFAGSLALSAAVEEEGEEPASRFSQAGRALDHAQSRQYATALAAVVLPGDSWRLPRSSRSREQGKSVSQSWPGCQASAVSFSALKDRACR